MEYGEKSIKEEVLLADLVRVAKELNNPKFSISDYSTLGKFTAVAMRDRFGSWNNAKQKINLEITPVMNTTVEDFFQNMLLQVSF